MHKQQQLPEGKLHTAGDLHTFAESRIPERHNKPGSIVFFPVADRNGRLEMRAAFPFPIREKLRANEHTNCRGRWLSHKIIREIPL